MTDMTDEERGWARVAEWLQAEIERQGVTLRRLELEGGVAYRTVQKLLAGEPVTRRDTLTRLANFLGYRADAVDRIRRNEKPWPLDVEQNDSFETGDAQRDYNATIPRISKGAQEAIDAIIDAEERKLES